MTEEQKNNTEGADEAPRDGYHSPLDYTGNPDHDTSRLETYEDPLDARPDASP